MLGTMITRIPDPEALDHDLTGGSWPHGLRPITVHFMRRTRRRRVNVVEALTKLTKLPPIIRWGGALYVPDPSTPGGPFQERHTEQEWCWLVKRWRTAPAADPGQLRVKDVARCGSCEKVWTGQADMCPPCASKSPAKAPDLGPMVESLGMAKTPPVPDSEPPPDTESSPEIVVE